MARIDLVSRPLRSGTDTTSLNYSRHQRRIWQAARVVHSNLLSPEQKVLIVEDESLEGWVVESGNGWAFRFEALAAMQASPKYQNPHSELAGLLRTLGADPLADQLEGHIRFWNDDSQVYSDNFERSLVLHDQVHLCDVDRLAMSIILGMGVERFSPEMIYQIAVGIWLHDVGHGHRGLGERQASPPEVRRYHGLLGAEYITSNSRSGLFMLSPSEQELAPVFVAHHQSSSSMNGLVPFDDPAARRLGFQPTSFRADFHNVSHEARRDITYDAAQELLAILRVSDAADVTIHRSRPTDALGSRLMVQWDEVRSSTEHDLSGVASEIASLVTDFRAIFNERVIDGCLRGNLHHDARMRIISTVANDVENVLRDLASHGDVVAADEWNTHANDCVDYLEFLAQQHTFNAKHASSDSVQFVGNRNADGTVVITPYVMGSDLPLALATLAEDIDKELGRGDKPSRLCTPMQVVFERMRVELGSPQPLLPAAGNHSAS